MDGEVPRRLPHLAFGGIVMTSVFLELIAHFQSHPQQTSEMIDIEQTQASDSNQHLGQMASDHIDVVSSAPYSWANSNS